MRSRLQRLDRVHGTAVANNGYHRRPLAR
jgi:hypothetical protein